MAARRNRQPLTTRGSAWGVERIELGLSMRQLAALSGINKGALSLIEAGRLIPSADEWAAVMRVLREAREERAGA